MEPNATMAALLQQLREAHRIDIHTFITLFTSLLDAMIIYIIDYIVSISGAGL